MVCEKQVKISLLLNHNRFLKKSLLFYVDEQGWIAELIDLIDAQDYWGHTQEEPGKMMQSNKMEKLEKLPGVHTRTKLCQK